MYSNHKKFNTEILDFFSGAILRSISILSRFLLRFIFNNLRLDFNFDKLIEPGDYLLQDAPAPIAAPQIPQSGAVIAPPPRADVIPTTGLTATETALLSPEEQIIRQRTRT